MNPSTRMSLSGICVGAGPIRKSVASPPRENAVDDGGRDQDRRLGSLVRAHGGVPRVNGDAVLLERKQAGTTELAPNLPAAHVVDLLQPREMSDAGPRGCPW